MRKFSVSLGVVAAALLAMPVVAPVAAQDSPQVFSPSGPWTADFGDDYCRIARDFGQGEDQISLVLERIHPGSNGRVLLVGNGLRLFRGAERIGMQFLPTGSERSSAFARSEMADGTQMVFLENVSVSDEPNFVQVFAAPGNGPVAPSLTAARELELAAGITGLSLSDGLIAPIELRTGRLRQVYQMLQDCTYDLIAHWGLDADKHRTMQRGAYPPAEPILPQGTIPFAEFRNLSGGFNQVRVMVGADGSPTSCHIHFPTLDTALNERICEGVMANAHFEPALDAEGQAMASYWTVPVPFLLGPPRVRR